MRIREATPADAERIREVHSTSITELGTQAYDHEQVKAWAAGCESADYMSGITADEVVFVVTDIDEIVMGFGSLTLAAPNNYDSEIEAEITGVYVHPTVAQQGIGTCIYTELEQQARANEIQSVGLSASLNAVSFYETHGFERIQEHTHEFSRHESTGVTGIVVEMKKEL